MSSLQEELDHLGAIMDHQGAGAGLFILKTVAMSVGVVATMHVIVLSIVEVVGGKVFVT